MVCYIVLLLELTKLTCSMRIVSMQSQFRWYVNIAILFVYLSGDFTEMMSKYLWSMDTAEPPDWSTVIILKFTQANPQRHPTKSKWLGVICCKPLSLANQLFLNPYCAWKINAFQLYLINIAKLENCVFLIPCKITGFIKTITWF